MTMLPKKYISINKLECFITLDLRKTGIRIQDLSLNVLTIYHWTTESIVTIISVRQCND